MKNLNHIWKAHIPELGRKSRVYFKVPLKLAELLGEITEKYRWFAVFYLVMMFFLAPVFVFALSVAGSFIFLAVTLPLLVSIFLIVVINLFQRSSRLRNVLPPFLRNWNFLPLFMHSLAPWDRCLILVWRLVRKVSMNSPLWVCQPGDSEVVGSVPPSPLLC